MVAGTEQAGEKVAGGRSIFEAGNGEDMRSLTEKEVATLVNLLQRVLANGGGAAGGPLRIRRRRIRGVEMAIAGAKATSPHSAGAMRPIVAVLTPMMRAICRTLSPSARSLAT